MPKKRQDAALTEFQDFQETSEQTQTDPFCSTFSANTKDVKKDIR